MKFAWILCKISFTYTCICFWSFSAGISIHLSQHNTSWEKATNQDQRLLDYDYITKNGWRPILNVIPEDEKFWIAATATPTAFVSWEGCAIWLGGPKCTKEVMSGGSIADCLKQCPKYNVYILLQGEQCRCVAKDNAGSCFKGTNIQNCEVLCRNNGNDRCGGKQNIFVSVYFRDKFPIEVNSTQNCVHASMRDNKTSFEATKSCYEYFTRRYICNGLMIENDGFLSWPQAFEKCGEKHAQMGFEELSSNNYWTSLRRSFEIVWMPHIGNISHNCVIVKKDSLHQLVVETDDCTLTHRYLYILLDKAHISDGNTLMEMNGELLSLGVFIVFAICVILVSLICYCNGQKRKERRKSRSLVAAGVREMTVESNEDPSGPSASPCLYYSSVTLHRLIDTTMSGQSANVYNKFASVQNSSISVYDRTHTSRQPLLIQCPENEDGFGAQTDTMKVPRIREENNTVKYATQEKGKHAPRYIRETDTTIDTDFSVVREEVQSVKTEITCHEKDPSKDSTITTYDCSKNVIEAPGNEAVCNSQTRPTCLLIPEMEDKIKIITTKN